MFHWALHKFIRSDCIAIGRNKKCGVSIKSFLWYDLKGNKRGGECIQQVELTLSEPREFNDIVREREISLH